MCVAGNGGVQSSRDNVPNLLHKEAHKHREARVGTGSFIR